MKKARLLVKFEGGRWTARLFVTLNLSDGGKMPYTWFSWSDNMEEAINLGCSLWAERQLYETGLSQCRG